MENTKKNRFGCLLALCVFGFLCSNELLQWGVKKEKWNVARVGLAGTMGSASVGVCLVAGAAIGKVLDKAEKKILDKVLPKIRERAGRP